MRSLKLLAIAALLSVPAGTLAQSWTQVSLGSSSTIRAIEHGSFGDKWVVGDNGLVAHSDHTRTVWTLENVSTTADLFSIRRPASTQVWVSGAQGTVRVGNTGTWNVRDAPTSQRVVLYSRQSGGQNALGDQGSLHQSVDFGQNWLPLSSGTNASLNHGAGSISTESWIVGDNGTILHSDDGGTTWTPQNSGTTANLHSIAQVATPWIVVVGEGGTFLRSSDGGTTWTQIPLGITTNLWDVNSSGQNGSWLMAVGDGGTVLRSTDIGATWCQVRTGISANLYACAMLTNNAYLVGGEGGVLLYTVDGGSTCGTLTALEDNVATTFALRGPYPQPVDGAGRFQLRMGQNESVHAQLFDVRGRHVASVFEGRLDRGDHTLTVNSRDLSAGMYFLRVKGESFAATRKVTVLR